MRLSRFFIDAPLSLGQHELPEAQAHYIARVLRHTAGDAVQLRTSLGSSNAKLEAINRMLAEHPSPHRELKRLSALLDDGTWLNSAEIQGSAIKIEGQSNDASAVMQQLMRQSAYGYNDPANPRLQRVLEIVRGE